MKTRLIRVPEDEIRISCACGSRGIRLKRSEEDVFMSFWMPLFYGIQYHTLWERIKLAWAFFWGKEYRLYDVVISLEDADALYTALGCMLTGEAE